MNKEETVLFILCNSKSIFDETINEARRLSYYMEQTESNMEVLLAHIRNLENNYRAIEENTHQIVFEKRLSDALDKILSGIFGGNCQIEQDYPSPDMMVKAYLEEIYSKLENNLYKLYTYVLNNIEIAE